MSGIAAKLQHNRDRAHGIGTNAHAVKYLNQDYECLKRDCLDRGTLFVDPYFDAEPSSLGFKELGPNSLKVRGITWRRPTVSEREKCAESRVLVAVTELISHEQKQALGYIGLKD